MTTNGIYLNGQPLDLKDCIDIQIVQDAFEFHYIHKPPLCRNYHKRALRRSPVRHLSALELAHIRELEQRKGGDPAES